jgi:hypothetical protein
MKSTQIIRSEEKSGRFKDHRCQALTALLDLVCVQSFSKAISQLAKAQSLVIMLLVSLGSVYFK